MKREWSDRSEVISEDNDNDDDMKREIELDEALVGGVARTGARGVAKGVAKGVARKMAKQVSTGRIPTRLPPMPTTLPAKVVGKAADNVATAIETAQSLRGGKHAATPVSKVIKSVSLSVSQCHGPWTMVLACCPPLTLPHSPSLSAQRLVPTAFTLTRSLVLGTALFEAFDAVSAALRAGSSSSSSSSSTTTTTTSIATSVGVSNIPTTFATFTTSIPTGAVPVVAGAVAGGVHGALSVACDAVQTHLVRMAGSGPGGSCGPMPGVAGVVHSIGLPTPVRSTGLMASHTAAHAVLFGTFFSLHAWGSRRLLGMEAGSGSGSGSGGDECNQENEKPTENYVIVGACGAVAGVASEVAAHALGPLERQGVGAAGWRGVLGQLFPALSPRPLPLLSPPLPPRATLFSGALSGALGFAAYLFAA